MKKIQVGRWLLYIVPIILCSCNPIYYTPNSHNVPMLSKKNQGSLAVLPNPERFECTGSYALTNDAAVLINGGLFTKSNSDTTDGGSGLFIEVGAGYYYKFAKYGLCDIYALAGYGSMQNHFPSTVTNNPGTNGKIRADLVRIGFQPSVGFTSTYFDAFASVRMTSLYYTGISGSFIFNGMSQTEYLRGQKGMFLAEPAITICAGYDFIKLQLQLGTSYNLTHSDFRQDKGWGSFGIVYRFTL